MPYLNQEQKEDLEKRGPSNPGQLNYALTKVIQFYLSRKGLSYHSLNDVIGALEACKLEFYRRLVSRYEDEKIKTNGDVYDLGPAVSSPTVLTPGSGS